MPEAPGAPAEPVWPVRVFTGAIFLVMFGLALAFVASYSRNVPQVESWLMIPVMAGAEPVTPGWLWLPVYEHHLPMCRLFMVTLFQGTFDIRPALYFNVVAFAVIAFALMRTAEWLRGRPAYTDAFFPLVLLHFGQWEAYIWHAMVAFPIPLLMAVAMLILILRAPTRLTWPTTLVLGTCLTLLPLSGGWGMVPVVFLLPWTVAGWFFVWRKGGPDTQGKQAVLGAFVLLTLVIIVFYFWSLEADTLKTAVKPDVIARTALQFMTVAFGSLGRNYWPSSQIVPVAIFGVTALLLVLRLVHAPNRERLRAGGLLVFLNLVLAMALAAGRGRGHESETAGLEPRYVCGAVLWLCAAYLAWLVYSPPAVRLFASWCFFTLALGLVLHNGYDGVQNGREVHRLTGEIEDSMRQGAAISRLIKDYGFFLFTNDQNYHVLGRGLEVLHEADVPPYDALRDDYPFKMDALPLKPTAVHGMTWSTLEIGGYGQVENAESHVSFAVGAPRYVCAVELLCQVSRPDGSPAQLRVAWKPAGRKDADWESKEVTLDAATAMPLVWLCERVEAVSIYPDTQAGDFFLFAVRLLVPEEESPPP